MRRRLLFIERCPVWLSCSLFYCSRRLIFLGGPPFGIYTYILSSCHQDHPFEKTTRNHANTHMPISFRDRTTIEHATAGESVNGDISYIVIFVRSDSADNLSKALFHKSSFS